jgi:pimeloyl-ACP methyl ester carboxylesterase
MLKFTGVKYVVFLFLLVFSPLLYADVTIENQTIQRNGFALHVSLYQDIDVAQIKPYPDILMIHGLTYSSHQFDVNVADYSLARALVKMGFRVWLMDITGYGQSQKPPDGFMVNTKYAAEDILAVVDSILKTRNVKKVNVLGWSWGTTTTSLFVSQYPDKVNKLVLYAPLLHGLGLPPPKTDYQPYSQEAVLGDFQLTAQGDIDSTMVLPAVVERYVAQANRFDAGGSPNGGRRDLSQPRHVLLIPYKQLSVPVLFIAGSRDSYLNAEKDLAFLMENSPKGSCKIIVPGGSHIMFLEKPYHEAFQKNVGSFFASGCQTLSNSP